MHLVSDTFSQLSNEVFSDNIKFINTLHEDVKYITIIIELLEKFRRCLQDRYQKDLKL